MQYLCNISRKTQRMKLIFLLADKHQIFLQIDTITFGGVARHAQITQYNKFAICNILWKNWVTKLIFCMQIIMKVSYKLLLWFLIGMVKHSQSYQNSKFPMSLQYPRKKRESWFFACRETSKISSNWYYYFRFVWPGMPKLAKITSLLFAVS